MLVFIIVSTIYVVLVELISLLASSKTVLNLALAYLFFLLIYYSTMSRYNLSNRSCSYFTFNPYFLLIVFWLFGNAGTSYFTVCEELLTCSDNLFISYSNSMLYCSYFDSFSYSLSYSRNKISYASSECWIFTEDGS